MTDDDRSGTEVAIMEATFEALSTHGYADITIQRIADAFPKSKSLLYYHYEDKEAIMRAFMEWLIDEFTAEVEANLAAGGDDPRTALEALLDELLPREFDDGERTFRVAILELQARAAHDPAYADRFAGLFDAMEAALVALVAEGVERGAFRDVDPKRAARLLLAVAAGGVTWTLSTDSPVAGDVRDALDVCLESYLYA